MYAARAAAILKDRAALEKLARDGDDNVKEAAIEGLAAVSGHGADAVYVEALATGRYQVLRAAAVALAGTDAPNAVPALKAALNRLVLEGHDNSRDARTAIAETLRGSAHRPMPRRGDPPIAAAGVTAAELRSVAARARPRHRSRRRQLRAGAHRVGGAGQCRALRAPGANPATTTA